MAQRTANARTSQEFFGFPEGTDSYSYPLAIKPTQVRWTVNAVNRGAIIQARPGMRQRFVFDMAVDTVYDVWSRRAGRPILHPQFLKKFSPYQGDDRLVFGVSGSVWQCKIAKDGQLSPAVQIPQLQFSADADQLIAEPCTQDADIVNGVVQAISTRRLLIIQDGVNRAGWWDGTNAAHFNPQKNIQVAEVAGDGTLIGDSTYPAGFNETRIGQAMAMSGNRLWVANGNNLYASNIFDPTHFIEELRLDSLPVIPFPERIVALADRGVTGTNQSVLIVFCENSTWTVQSGVQARLPDSTYGYPGWQGVPDFRRRIFAAVGCNAPKSVVSHRGLIYWRSRDGICMFDTTQTAFSTQNIPPIDFEMAYSKLRVGPNQAGACGGMFDAYAYWGVPVGPVTNSRPYNGHIQVLDRQTMVVRAVGLQGPFSYGQTGWQGVWTGIRPVEFAGDDIPYALSMDLDGSIRIWQLFAGERADNCKPFPWLVETKSHQMSASLFDNSIFRYFRLRLDNVIGKVSIVGLWKGLRGEYHELMNSKIIASSGPIWSGLPGNPFFSGKAAFLPQTRDIRSPNNRGPDEPGSAGVESKYTDPTDTAFSLLLKITGQAALIGYQLNVDGWTDNTEGEVTPDETGLNALPAGEAPLHTEDTTPDGVQLAPTVMGLTPLRPKFAEDEIYAAPGGPTASNIAGIAPAP
jgi:hypothetical protein